jgi:hypothetical protein
LAISALKAMGRSCGPTGEANRQVSDHVLM